MSCARGLLLARRYRLESRIAVGGFGEVWRATDVMLARPVAIKLLQAGYLQHPEIMARFRTEARSAAALSHPNIAYVYDYGEADGPDPPFLVMELVSGRSVAEALAGGALDPALAMDIVAQTARGLEAAHRAGFVHRDIKPGNLLLSDDGLVKITDFGIAHAAGSAPVTRTGMMIGTAAYLAPERVRGSSATPASDLYSLGIVGYECLTGVPPFAGDVVTVAVAHRDNPLPPLPASVPAGAAALVRDLTAKDPAARPPTAAEVWRRAALLRDQLAGSDGAATCPALLVPPASPPVARTTGGHRLALVAVMLAVVAVITGFAVAGFTPSGAAPQRHPASSRSGDVPRSSPQARLASVAGRSLLGRPVDAVVRQLHQLGLAVRLRWRVSDLGAPGMVVSVSPDGPLTAGQLVTVTGALQVVSVSKPATGASGRPNRPATRPRIRHHHGHGGRHHGGGD